MKIPWKALAILIVLGIAIYYDLPTFSVMVPDDVGNRTELEERLSEINKSYEELKSLQLVLGEANKNRLEILMEEGKAYPVGNKILEDVLGENNYSYQQTDEKHYLVLNPEKSRDVFVSQTAERVNDLLGNTRNVIGIEIAENDDVIIFTMEEGTQLTDQTQPIKGFLEDDLDFYYDEPTGRYLSRKKQDGNTINLGLDLQGGMYLDVGIKQQAVLDVILDNLVKDVEDKFIEDKVNYEKVAKLEGNQVEVLLKPEEKYDLGENLLQQVLSFDITPKENGYLLTFKEAELEEIKKNALQQALETIRNRIDGLGVKEPSIQKQGDDSIIIQLPGLKDPGRARDLIGKAAVLDFMLVADGGDPENPGEKQVVLYEEVRHEITKQIISKRPYLLEDEILLKGDKITDARVSLDQNSATYAVSISFDSEGTRIFADITAKNVRRSLAIVLDGKVQSAPVIQVSIPDGEAQITGSFTVQEATDLAISLRSGALPAPLIIHEERTVGASLGEDSIRKGITALALGFCIVIIFMVIYYNVAGIFSVLALIFNLLLILATLAAFQATLTLPGMAGLILTIGMAVDANVLIFERIREEIFRGTQIRKAIHIGFQKATVTILDANITTIIAAVILFQFGTGPVKGFALTLSIGIAASMFTSIIVGRFLFELFYLNRKNLESVSV